MYLLALLLLVCTNAAFMPHAWGSPWGYGSQRSYGRPSFYGTGYSTPRVSAPTPVVRETPTLVREAPTIAAPVVAPPVVAPQFVAPQPVYQPAPMETDNYGNALVEHPFAYLNDD